MPAPTDLIFEDPLPDEDYYGEDEYDRALERLRERDASYAYTEKGNSRR
jgi:hypothetical protein